MLKKMRGKTNGVAWSDTVGKECTCALLFAPSERNIQKI